MSGANLARMEKPARSSWSEMNLLVRKTQDGESGETYKTPWLTCHFSEGGEARPHEPYLNSIGARIFRMGCHPHPTRSRARISNAFFTSLLHALWRRLLRSRFLGLHYPSSTLQTDLWWR